MPLLTEPGIGKRKVLRESKVQSSFVAILDSRFEISKPKEGGDKNSLRGRGFAGNLD